MHDRWIRWYCFDEEYFNDYVTEGKYEFVKEAFEMPIGELLERIETGKGKTSHPLLMSILYARVNIDINTDDRREKVKKKRKIGMANKVRSKGNHYEKY